MSHTGNCTPSPRAGTLASAHDPGAFTAEEFDRRFCPHCSRKTTHEKIRGEFCYAWVCVNCHNHIFSDQMELDL